MVDLTDVSLVDEDANSILADDTNRAIPGNVIMLVAPPGGQYVANGSGQKLNQVTPPNCQIFN